MSKINTKIINSNLYLQKSGKDADISKFGAFLIKNQTTNYVYDLKKTFLILKKTLNFIENLIGLGGQLVFIGSSNNLQDSKLKKLCIKYNQVYLESPWCGGGLTNNAILKSTYKRLKGNITQNEVKYLKFNKLFKNIVSLKKMPQALVSFSYNKSFIVINECKILKIPVVCLVNPNIKKINLVDYPIIGDDSSEVNVEFYIHLIERAIKRGSIKKKKYGKTF